MQEKPNIITYIQSSLQGNQLELVNGEHITICLRNGIMMSQTKLEF